LAVTPKSLFRNIFHKNGSFFAIFHLFQLLSTGYAPQKTQKLTKNQPVFPNGTNPEQL
jgi:hypothetical protein